MHRGVATGGAYISADTLGYSSPPEIGRCGRGVNCHVAVPAGAGACAQKSWHHKYIYACCAGSRQAGCCWYFNVNRGWKKNRFVPNASFCRIRPAWPFLILFWSGDFDLLYRNKLRRLPTPFRCSLAIVRATIWNKTSALLFDLDSG